MILDDARVTFADIWQGDFDIVVASYTTIMYQHKRLKGFKRYMSIWKQCGKDVADRVAEKETLPTKRPTLSVFTALLEILACRIPTKVLDEAHTVSKWAGVKRAAVKALLAFSVNLLTGTPCANHWFEILNTADLLPYEFPKTRAEWFTVFAPDQADQRHKAPNLVEFSNVVRYLLPFTFGRTIDLLELPGIIYEPRVEFELSAEKSELTLWLIDKFLRCVRMGAEEGEANEEEKNTAMAYCTKVNGTRTLRLRHTLTSYLPTCRPNKSRVFRVSPHTHQSKSGRSRTSLSTSNAYGHCLRRQFCKNRANWKTVQLKKTHP